MLRVLVTVMSFGGWLIGLGLMVRLRRSSRPPTLAFESDQGRTERLRLLCGRAAGALVGCLVAGVLVMGFGSRLMMRVLAASSSGSVQGAITDMDAVIGDVTVGGTFGLVVFVGAGAGVIGWLIRLVARRWLPARSVAAGVVGAGIGAGAVARGSALLDPESRDFVLLTPDWLAVGLILTLIITFGVTLGVLGDRAAELWPTPGRGWSLLWAAPLALLSVVPPVAAAMVVVAGVRIRVDAPDGSPLIKGIDGFGRIVTPIASLLGAFWTLAAAGEILRA